MRKIHLQMRNAHLQIGMVFTSVHLEMCPHQTTGDLLRAHESVHRHVPITADSLHA